MKTYLLFVLLVLLVACSATHDRISDDDLLIKDSYVLSPPSMILANEAQKDVGVLIYALENGYGGRKYVPQGIFYQVIDELSLLKQTAEKQETKTFCQKIGAALVRIPDNHLSARMQGKDCSEEHEKTDQPGRVGKNVAAGSEKVWSVQERQVSGRTIPVLAFTDLPMGEDKAWDGFLDAVKRIKNESPALIIDLRGEGGGSDTMPRKMAQKLYGGAFPEAQEKGVKSTTPATQALLFNGYQLKVMRLKRGQKEIPAYLLDRSAKALQDYRDAKKGKFPKETVSEFGNEDVEAFNPTTGFARPIYILIDRGCTSSCESTLEALEAHPFVTTVGENTGGFIHFGNMGQLVLPHSQIIVQMATDYWKYKDNRFVEKIGYSPKIRVPEGQDALVVALKELETKL